MLKSFKSNKINAQFYLADEASSRKLIPLQESYLKFIWVTEGRLEISIDGKELLIEKNQIVCCTYLQKVRILKAPDRLFLLMFNREFYCIHTFDEEVSCNGLLFFGSDYTPVLTLDEIELTRIHTLVNVLKEEFDTIDNSQEEMLRILLKRFIIRCNRLAKNQMAGGNVQSGQIELIRKFNALVEEHYKSKKQVIDYAELLNKSPKTITNIFNQYSEKSPLQIILNRVVLEAKRLLLYTDKSSKEISLELDFENQAYFSKFFKKQTGLTPSEFKEQFAHQQFGNN